MRVAHANRADVTPTETPANQPEPGAGEPRADGACGFVQCPDDRVNTPPLSRHITGVPAT